jgi:AraC-like DNA-binding protein/quercetin dioxygenase-like cupin family protein
VVTVPARSAKDRARPAEEDVPVALRRIGVVDMRRGGRAVAGSHVHEGDALVTPWHSHDLHQVEYAVNGVVEVETAAAHHLLPPQQAAWIPAGVEHRATLAAGVRTVAVLFDPALVPGDGDRVRILAAGPLLREMVLHAQRWPIDRSGPDTAADDFFRALGHVVAEGLDHEAPLSLPTSTDPIVGAAMAHTRAHLDTATTAEVCRAVGVSERTLRRRFHAATGRPWRDYLQQARLLRAMALLVDPGRSVLDVSVAVGFDNVSAFTRAFTRRCGETPSAYRTRTLTGG